MLPAITLRPAADAADAAIAGALQFISANLIVVNPAFLASFARVFHCELPLIGLGIDMNCRYVPPLEFCTCKGWSLLCCWRP